MQKRRVAKVKRAKAGKGKKEGKQETKAVKESDIEKAKATAALWELRLRVTDSSLVEYREASRRLARANEELTDRLYRAEQDAIDITGFLTRQDAAKENKINALQKSLIVQEELARKEQKKVVEDYTTQINEMKELFMKKSSDFDMIQDGMKKIKEFQKRKSQMEQELIDIKENMDVAEKDHRESLNKLERKFFIEKVRLEEEAEKTIALVEERAHNKAIVKLDDASRSVFKENVRLNEALKYHIKESEQLQILTNSMFKEKTSLALDKNTLELMVKKNAAQMEAQNKELSKLRATVAYLQQARELKEDGPETQEEEEETLVSVPAAQVELEELRRVLAVRERELGHVKRLARGIVQQRSELERFFHEALVQVKQEIAASRSQYKKEALQAYRRRLREATAGKQKFPPIRTFGKGPHSTNSVYSDMEAAARWTHQPGSRVEVTDLTWEQKEQVLRLLFAKMNGQRERKASRHPASSEMKRLTDSDAAGEDAKGITREEPSPATFITRAPESVRPPSPSSLPDVHSA
ncbi:basal body-orientation factor 1-like [Pungitius pungitius]|uniref:basal body-orientation factor 1-like n=1 Tax=Pungitius pungitius TaxID=134920 RepID=UPI002E12D512